MYFNVRVNVLRSSYAIHRHEIYSQLYPDEGVGVGGVAAVGAWLIKALGLKWTEPPIHSVHTIGSEPRLCRPNGIKDCSGDYTATSPTPSYTLYLTNRITVDKTLCA